MGHDYLTAGDVLGMRAVLMKRYGVLPDTRDPGALESLVINHPFVDGNTRIAFLLLTCFCS